MKKMSIKQMEQLEAGGGWSGFCKGFGAATAVYGAGIAWAGLTPPGMVAGGAIIAINLACIFS